MSQYRPEGLDDVMNQERPVVSGIGWRGLLRFAWRQLTSMRVALMLLMLLAVAAIPGSLVPQRDQDPQNYAQFVADHPQLAPWLDRFQLFDVYTSVWFSAVYLLLFISLIGCIVPRVAAHARGLRTPPPRAPLRFSRLPATAAGDTLTPDDDVIAQARARLRGPVRWLPRYRVVTAVERSGAQTLSAERGYLRETGNLVFHLALVGLLVAVSLGQLFHYRGQVLLVQGRTFANAQVNYGSFSHGAWFNPEGLDPFRLRLDSFEAVFRPSDAQPQDFTANVTVSDPRTGGEEIATTIKVNSPLDVGGAKVYLQGNGYAPNVTVIDSAGNTALSGPVPFIPQDAVYTSQGVIKVPDVTDGDQIGFVGYLLPTGTVSDAGTWSSVFPDLWDPVLVLTMWQGDLGLDSGVPQNVYRLDTSAMTQVEAEDGTAVTLVLRPGESVELPGGAGTLVFNDIQRYVALDLRADPALVWILVFALIGAGGLILSLFVPRRRVWVRVKDGHVEVGGLARSEDGGLAREVSELRDAVAGPYDAQDGGPTTPGRDGGLERKGERGE